MLLMNTSSSVSSYPRAPGLFSLIDTMWPPVMPLTEPSCGQPSEEVSRPDLESSLSGTELGTATVVRWLCLSLGSTMQLVPLSAVMCECHLGQTTAPLQCQYSDGSFPCSSGKFLMNFGLYFSFVRNTKSASAWNLY